METEDGFIVGIHEYCDRWCERCAFTARCRVFALEQEIEFALSRGHTLEDVLGPPEASIIVTAPGQEAEFADAGLPVTTTERLAAGLAPCDRELERRTKELAFRQVRQLWACRQAASSAGAPSAAIGEALEVIGRYSCFIPSKVFRTLNSLVRASEDSDLWTDANGSAKVAMLALGRVQAAWVDLAEARLVPVDEAGAILSEAVWVIGELERRLPDARRFCRPGLDEIEAVIRLRLDECG